MTTDLLILTLIGGIIFLVPLLCRKLHIPAIVGLILAGMVVGEHGFGLVPSTDTITLFASVGMLYIMFMSGVEIDMNDFRRNSGKAILLGLLTFLFPALLAIAVGHWLLHYSWLTSILLGAMLGSHTLMTYPIVSRYNIQHNKAVVIVVGATMIAVLFSLLTLAAISSIQQNSNITVWLTMGAKVSAMLVIVLWLFPLIARWFFRHVNDPLLEFLLVIIIMLMAALMAWWAGLEGIIGAFLAGVALNRLVPNLSPLMNRLNFVGNTFFIPVFLLSVGMMVDIRAFWNGWTVLLLALLICAIKLAGKGLAALVAKRLFRLSSLETELTFALTHATAAGTLAVVTIGYQMSFFTADMLNASVLMILLLCTTSSFLTEHAAKLIALSDQQASTTPSARQHVLIPVSNPTTDEALIDLAELSMVSSPTDVVHPLAIVTHADDTHSSHRLLEHTVRVATSYNASVETITQMAANITNGIQKVIEEREITQVLIGASPQLHSPIIEGMITSVSCPLAIYKQMQPLATIQRLIVAVPQYAERELSFALWLTQVERLAEQTGASVVFHTNPTTQQYIIAFFSASTKHTNIHFRLLDDWANLLLLSKELKANDLFITVVARRSTISYNPLFALLQQQLLEFFSANSTLVIYPAQTMPSSDSNLFLSEEPQSSQSFNIISRIKNYLLRLYRRRQYR